MGRIAVFFLSCFFISASLFAAEEPEVKLRKLEDRTEAVVSTAPATKAAPAQGKGLIKGFSSIENGVANLAAATCGAVGKGTDITVTAIQQTLGFAFSPLFRALDVVNWGKGKKR